MYYKQNLSSYAPLRSLHFLSIVFFRIIHRLATKRFWNKSWLMIYTSDLLSILSPTRWKILEIVLIASEFIIVVVDFHLQLEICKLMFWGSTKEKINWIQDWWFWGLALTWLLTFLLVHLLANCSFKNVRGHTKMERGVKPRMFNWMK